MSGYIYQWIDLVWLPIGWYAVSKNHRLLTIAFLLTCSMMARLQVELLRGMGWETGFLPIMQTDIWSRALIVYSIVTALFLVLAHYSPNTNRMVFFAATLTIFIFAFCVSMIAMIL